MKTQCPHCESPLVSEAQRFCYRCGYDLSVEKSPETEGVESSLTDEGTAPMPGAASSRSGDDQPGGELSRDEGNPSLRIILPTEDVFDRELIAGETTIGKGPRNDIVVSDSSVSTTHVLIYSDSGGYYIKDLGSKNGTYVQGARLTAPHRLRHGEMITIGRSRLTFRLQSQSDTVVLNAAEDPASQYPTQNSLADALVAAGWATDQDIERMLAASGGVRLVDLVIAKKLGSEEALRDLMSRTFGIKTVSLSDADDTVWRSFPPKLAIQKHLYPLRRINGSLLLAVCDPTDHETFDALRSATGLDLEIALAAVSEIKARAYDRYGARLVGVSPSGERIERIIDLPDIEIGKASHNHVVLSDPTVSNSHAIILARDGAYSIIDLSSTNGTFVSAERLGTQAKTLRHGDTVQIGATTLTFRNPSETPENITAVLSADVAGEVRSRTANQGVPIAASTPAPNLEQFAAAGSPQPGLTTDETKKKKIKDDRIKAAYVTAFGRILAALLSVALTVVLALYISNRGAGTEKTRIESGKKGRAKIKIAGSSQESPFQGGTFEASGVVQVPGSDSVLFVDDNRPSQVLWMQLDENGKQKGAVKAVDLGVRVDDPESITYGGGFFYMASSQSNPAAAGNSLIRFAFDPDSGKVTGKPDVIGDLRTFLINSVDELKADGPKPANQGGLNIEGLAWDPNRERLLIGLRSPLMNEQAVIIPVRLKDPHGDFSAANLVVEQTGITHLSLGGLGVRDIQYDSQLRAFHVIAGEPQHHDKKTFALWEWDGNGGKGQNPGLTQETPLEPKMKPEGICRVSIGQHTFVFIVGDASQYTKLDYAAAD